VRSILEQDCDLELVMSDDGSRDGTADFARSLADPRVKLVLNVENLGIFGNLNRCLRAARGSLVQIFSQDDLMCPGFLASQAARLSAHPDAGLVYGAPLYIDDTGSVLPSTFRDDTPERIDLALYLWIASHYAALPASISSVMLPRRTLETVGFFNPSFRVAGDIEYYNRIAERFVFARNTEPLHKVRAHRRAASALSSAGPLYLAEEAALQGWYRDRWSKRDYARITRFRASLRGGYHLGWIARAARRGEIAKAIAALRLLHSLYPLQWILWWQCYTRLSGQRLKPFLAPPS
jgi:glycosyltransferase involved in cell wall biosynthesis